MVPALFDIVMAGNDNVSNTIGVGGYWDYPRPVDVKGAYFTQTGQTGSPFSFQYVRYLVMKIISELP